MVVITWDPELEAPPVEADDKADDPSDEEPETVDEDRDWMLLAM